MERAASAQLVGVGGLKVGQWKGRRGGEGGLSERHLLLLRGMRHRSAHRDRRPAVADSLLPPLLSKSYSLLSDEELSRVSYSQHTEAC